MIQPITEDGMVSGPVPDPVPRSVLALGFIWTVYPRSSGRPMIANGHSSSEDKARTQVECVLEDEPDYAAWGVVLCPWGVTEVCRRDAVGGYDWQPLFKDPEPQKAPLQAALPQPGLQPVEFAAVTADALQVVEAASPKHHGGRTICPRN